MCNYVLSLDEEMQGIEFVTVTVRENTRVADYFMCVLCYRMNRPQTDANLNAITRLYVIE